MLDQELVEINQEYELEVSLEEGVLEITIDRPKQLNALNGSVLKGILRLQRAIEFSSGVRVVVLRGAGEKAFVAGADIAFMRECSLDDLTAFIELGQRVMRNFTELKQPIIAVVSGYALGGGLELALASDLILGSDKARIGLPEITLGVIPGFGGTQRLIDRVGVGAARRLIYTGDMITAAEAFRIGLIDELVEEAEQLGAESRELALKLSKAAPLALGEAKSCLAFGRRPSLLAGLRSETEAFLRLAQTEDGREGFEAFVVKRTPDFKGK